MEPAIRVLFADSTTDRRNAAVDALHDANDRIHVTPVDSIAAARDRLADQPVDCVVAAPTLSDGTGLDLFEAGQAADESLPFVLLSDGTTDPAAAFDAGVTDVVPYVDGAYGVLAERIESCAERRLSASSDETARRQYQAFIDNVPGIVYRSSADTDSPFESAYGTCEAVSGYTSEQLKTDVNWATDVVHPEDRQTAQREVTAAIERGDRFEVTYRIRTRDGDVRWVSDRGWEVDTTERIVEGLIVDVTDRVEREQELQREHQRFSDLFSNFPEPTIAYGFEDGTTVFRRVNAAFESLFGLDEADIQGESVNELLVPSDRQAESEQIDQQVETGEMVDRVVTRRAADGLRIFNLRSIPVDTGGEIDGFAVYSDITERRQHQRELERQNERLEEFASIVSHDLRNPLNVAKGHLDLAARECESDHLDTVENALERMETLIGETLALARQGEMVTDTQSVDLGDLVEGCWEMVQTGDASLTLNEPITIQGDPERIKQLLENLFRNAIDHVGTDVTITVGRLPDGFYVADDGPGIPADERGEVFEAGYTTSDDGTGFGLPIVKTIVEAHNWSITITDSEDGGARFEITGVTVSE